MEVPYFLRVLEGEHEKLPRDFCGFALWCAVEKRSFLRLGDFDARKADILLGYRSFEIRSQAVLLSYSYSEPVFV